VNFIVIFRISFPSESFAASNELNVSKTGFRSNDHCYQFRDHPEQAKEPDLSDDMKNKKRTFAHCI
jgi:hypothetical protein